MSKGTQASWAQRRVSRAKARASGHYGKSLVESLLNGLHLQPYQEGFFASLMRGDTLLPLSARAPFTSPFPTRRFEHPSAPNLQQVAKVDTLLSVPKLPPLTDEELRVAGEYLEKRERLWEAHFLAGFYGFPKP